MIDVGHVNPEKLLFTNKHLYSIEKVAPQKVSEFSDLMEDKATKLFREHPFQQSPDFIKSLRNILESKDFKSILNFN